MASGTSPFTRATDRPDDLEAEAAMATSWAAELRKKKGGEFRGYPIGTVAFYGPDDETATKVVAGIQESEDAEPSVLKKWFSEDLDARIDPRIGREVKKFLRRLDARSVVVTRGIIGCPHEEGIDYPTGESCPECPYWEGRDRWENV